jgi:hypothetical protein
MMRCTMKRSIRKLIVALAPVLFTALTPLASVADERVPYDARLEGYPQNVTLDGGGTALSWLLLIILAALCIGVMFKNANRSHLD